MNPFNKLWIFKMWLLAAWGAGGALFAHDRFIPVATSVLIALMGTAVVVGSDRADRLADEIGGEQ